MSGMTKFILGGLLIVLALLGIKSLLPTDPANAPPSADGWEQPMLMPNANLPSPDTLTDNSRLTNPKNDKPEEDDTKVELVGEPDTKEPTAKAPAAEEAPASVAAAPTIPEPPADEITTSPTPAITPTPAVPVPQPVVGQTGKLEIVAQSESGKAIKANVYVQQTNGANIDKATYTNKATFSLKPGKYKITVRAEGYASLSRNISVPDGAVVNEIFPLPAIAASTPAPAAPPPITRAPPQPAPMPAQQPGQRDGKLRVVALSADDGSPIKVNFTIARLDGTVVDRINNVSLAELTLPPQEFVVSFDFQGFQGYKSLTVQPGQVSTHTFNIRGVSGQSQAPAPHMPPMDNFQQQQQQPQNVEDMLMQRLQDELQKHLTN